MGNLSSLSPYYRAGVGEAMGAAYRPAMMEFDGSTGTYEKTAVTTSGNKVTCVLRFNRAAFTGGGYEYLVNMNKTQERLVIATWATDYADADIAGCISVWSRNSANGIICNLHSPTGFLDGEDHTLLYSFDGDTGVATFIIDGADADDTGNADRIAPTTGTMTTGAAFIFNVAGAYSGAYFGGSLGFLGYDDAYLINWSDFFDSANNPIKQDESTWANSGWGAQPLFWNEHGFMEDNRGSAGDMTKNGTINIADTEVVT